MFKYKKKWGPARSAGPHFVSIFNFHFSILNGPKADCSVSG